MYNGSDKIKVYFCSEQIFLIIGHFSFSWSFRTQVPAILWLHHPPSSQLDLQDARLRQTSEEQEHGGECREGLYGQSWKWHALLLLTSLWPELSHWATRNCQGNVAWLCDQEEEDEVSGKPTSFCHGNRSQRMTRLLVCYSNQRGYSE